MELMATSLDKFYKFVYCTLDAVIPEEILGKITLAVSLRRTRRLQPVCFTCVHVPLWLKPAALSLADCEGTQPLKGKLENNPQR